MSGQAQSVVAGTEVSATRLTLEEAGYPSALGVLGSRAQKSLWVRGDVAVLSQLRESVTIVGAKSVTGAGQQAAFEAGKQAAARGLIVVSGGGYGVAAAAHEGALAAGGRTVAVVAGDVTDPWPVANRELFARIEAAGGVVLSQDPPKSLPTRARFLARNELLAAVSTSVAGIELAPGAGAWQVARCAAELDRVVMVLKPSASATQDHAGRRFVAAGDAVWVQDVPQLVSVAMQEVREPGARPRALKLFTKADAVVATTPGCPHCRLQLQLFAQAKIRVDARDVSQPQHAGFASWLRDRGFRQAPVTLIQPDLARAAGIPEVVCGADASVVLALRHHARQQQLQSQGSGWLPSLPARLPAAGVSQSLSLW